MSAAIKARIYQTHGVATNEFIKLGGKDVEGAVYTARPSLIVDDLAEGTARSVRRRRNSSPPTRLCTRKNWPRSARTLWTPIVLVGNAMPAALAPWCRHAGPARRP